MPTTTLELLDLQAPEEDREYIIYEIEFSVERGIDYGVERSPVWDEATVEAVRRPDGKPLTDLEWSTYGDAFSEAAAENIPSVEDEYEDDDSYKYED